MVLKIKGKELEILFQEMVILQCPHLGVILELFRHSVGISGGSFRLPFLPERPTRGNMLYKGSLAPHPTKAPNHVLNLELGAALFRETYPISRTINPQRAERQNMLRPVQDEGETQLVPPGLCPAVRRQPVELLRVMVQGLIGTRNVRLP